MNNISPKAKEEISQANPIRVLTQRQVIGGLGAAVVFAAVLFGLPHTFDGPPGKMLAIVAGAIVLWVTEAIPIGLTGVLMMVAMLLLHPVPIKVVYSGYSSSAFFLILGGMMMASAVNETGLAKRITYYILARWGGNAKGLLASILLIPQVQAFFIPAAAVRTTLLLPVALNVLDTVGVKPESRLRKMILLAVAFGGTVSGTAVMTAAISNILTVGMLNELYHVKITYFQWFLYALPLWLLLMPGIFLVLLFSFPLKPEEREFPHVKAEIQKRLRDFGPLSGQEIRCMVILLLTVATWMTEPLHGLDPSIPALASVVLMSLPGIGCANWSNIVKVNFNTILLLGATLSLGYAMNDSGAAGKIGAVLGGTPWVLSLMQNPIVAILFVLIATQTIHLLMSNVSTAVVTLIPIYIGLSITAGINPVFICFTAALTCLHGYILVVESMPNLIVHSTGQISQREFLLPGVYATLLMMMLTVLIALTWWKWFGLL